MKKFSKIFFYLFIRDITLYHFHGIFNLLLTDQLHILVSVLSEVSDYK